MHYRPRPRGFKYQPFIPTKVKVSTIKANIDSGKYDVMVFYTDKARIVNAPIVKKIEGDKAIAVSIQLLSDWADADGKVEKCMMPTKKGILHMDFMGYNNIYCQLKSDRHDLIVLTRK